MNDRKMLIYILYMFIGYSLFASIFLICYSNLEYKERELIYANGDTIFIKSSLITNSSYDNKMIAVGQKFLVIDINTTINYSNFYLHVGDYFYGNTNDFSDKFVDISRKSLIYVLNSKDLNKNYSLHYTYAKDGITMNMEIKLNPIEDEQIIIKKYKINDELNLNIFSNSFKIKKYEIKNKYNYKYVEKENVITNIINSNKQVLRLVFENNLYSEMLDFYNEFSLIYVLDGREYVSLKKNMEVKNIANEFYFEVDENIINADKIWLQCVVRQNAYQYVLK